MLPKTPEDNLGTLPRDQSSERTPLLPESSNNYSAIRANPDDKGKPDQEGQASFSSCAINLANTILGTGMLAMPSAIASVGLIPGICLIVYSGLASGLGLYLLSLCARRTHPPRSASFFACSQITWPHAGVFFDLAIAIKCFGVSISYLIIIGDLMPEFMTSFFGISDEYMPVFVSRRFWITLSMVAFIAPLSFLRRLDSLRYTSVIALFAVFYLSCIVIWHAVYPVNGVPEIPHPTVEYVSISTRFFTSLPVFVFAFTCHQNIFTVYNELKDNAQVQINSVISTSIGSATAIYEMIGVLGYLQFGKLVQPNIILEYPATLFVDGGRLAIVILVLFSYPLQAHPCRNSLDKVLSWRPHKPAPPHTRHHHHRRSSSHHDGSRSRSRSPKRQHSGQSTPTEPSPFKYVVMTTGILAASYALAITVTRLDLVLSFVGSTGSTIISFILPGLFYYKLHESDPWTWRKVVSVYLATYGCLVMLVCLCFNVKRIVEG
ncbi:hypothetical protein BZG36_02797 [Bifiguratus adelaidae]|uniref:Amino acid transporter transmembrane domain-containing protein n=1 Tax=Bifiguratus adelaidae TaxID=1938954 RepID=A0A261Y1I0_9FUNG|nr:hypothetical protein BZG36_02797 [Bifiguratus adelaidae]